MRAEHHDFVVGAAARQLAGDRERIVILIVHAVFDVEFQRDGNFLFHQACNAIVVFKRQGDGWRRQWVFGITRAGRRRKNRAAIGAEPRD